MTARAAAPIVSFGEVLWDVFPDGERLGGCAANVAYHLAQLGAVTALVSRVGRDLRGSRARRQLEEVGVDVSHLQVDAERPTGAVRVEMVAGAPRFSIVEAAAWDRIEIDGGVRALLHGARAIVFGTLAQRTPVVGGALSDALRSCPPGVERVLDLNVRPPFDTPEVVLGSLELATVVKLNEPEAAALRERFGVTDVARWLIEHHGVRLVALTRAERGSVLVARRDRVEHDAASASAGGDPVGAGDAFTAVLTLGLCEGWPLDRLGRAANRYAGRIAEEPGATPRIHPEDARRIAGLDGG